MTLINRLIKRLTLEKKLFLIRKSIKKKQFKPENSILIFSDPRGGSTWLAELIAELPDSFIYWEPLALNYNKEIRQLNFGWRQHIPVNVLWSEAKVAFDNILSISILNEWTTLKMNIGRSKGSLMRSPIVKICRGNHLLPWLVRQYKFKFKPIYMIRHPMAVISSQMKQGGWDNKFDGFKIPNMPFNEMYVKHEGFLKSLKTKREALLAVWCITNKDLMVNGNSNWHFIYYENLLIRPEETLKDIFMVWGLPFPNEISNMARKWSSTSIDNEGVASMKQLKKWQLEFSHKQLKKFQFILDYFEISTYTVNDLLPKQLITN